MLGHLSDEMLWDAVEGTAAARAQRHLDACATCRARVEEASAGLAGARDAEVPEPSPLYWESFRASVSRRLGEEPAPAVPHAVWRAWLALGAAALAVVVALLPASRPSDPPATLPAWSALPAQAEDEAFGVLEGLTGEADEVRALAVDGECQGLGECLSGLSEEESRKLAEALKAELSGGREDS